ncbi:MAG: 16S rRNA (uracil(1498)-N(3))-methyltransferase [Clostridiales Family XIII bacterium]|jgi:16S rRNA (uracil1498-N3)-methyltransferase|nr:16S rRNA (uracil(1498)-N(3))-methyltransferase [Clostridiales Family XIII bacterium]
MNGMVYIEDPGDVRHIRDVLRMNPGDNLIAVGGEGMEYTCRINEIGDAVRLFIVNITHAPEPRVKVTLYQCVPKHGKMETIIQKSTELGAVRFVPVFSERSVPKPNDMARKVGRWQRVAQEASKQSGREAVPVVDTPLTLEEAVETFGEYDLMLFPYENEDRATIKCVLRGYSARHGIDDGVTLHSGPRVALVIGPEGGFTDSEAFAIEGAGAVPCSIGGTILRTETAGPAAIAMVMYELEM